MEDPLTYRLEHANGTVDLALDGRKLSIRSSGNGLLDRPRSLELELSEVRQFYVAGAIGAQTVVQRVNRQLVTDPSFNSEFLVTYERGGRVGQRRVFVDAADPGFQRLRNALAAARPDADLQQLDAGEAFKQMGMLAPTTALRWIIGLLVGVPVVIALAYLLFSAFGG